MFDSNEWSRLEKTFTAWAEKEESIRAVFLVGSRARKDNPADAWADMDLMIFTTNRGAYLEDSGWLNAIGAVWDAIPSTTAGGDAEWLVTFAGGYNIDFVMLDAASLNHLVQANPLPEPFVRGFQILVDKDSLAARVPRGSGRPKSPPLPAEPDFIRLVNSFWYLSFYVAKQIRRGDMLKAKTPEGDLREMILAMLGWYAQVMRGPDVDLWHTGRYMEQWVDPQSLQEFPATFSLYEAADSWRGLNASMTLFRRIACAAADRLGYPYPVETDERMSGLVKMLEKGNP